MRTLIVLVALSLTGCVTPTMFINDVCETVFKGPEWDEDSCTFGESDEQNQDAPSG